MFQTGHLVCSKQDISCVPRRTSQDISCVPGRTSPVFQAGHFLCSKQKWNKNREDSSDFNDFLKESIASTKTLFSKKFARPKKISKKNCDARTVARTRWQEFCGGHGDQIVIDGYKLDAVSQLVGWLVGWLVGRSVDRSVGWLVGWLVSIVIPPLS